MATAIQATSQSSRFAAADVGIDLKSVQISVAGRDLLSDAHVQLLSGVHYGLIGRNGVGKSILLTCLSNGSLLSPALREQLRVLYINQTLDDRSTMVETMADTATTTSSTEKRSKRRGKSTATGNKREPETSEDAAEPSLSSSSSSKQQLQKQQQELTALQELLRWPYPHQQQELSELEKWQALAQSTSGKRGHAARQKLVQLESSMDKLSVVEEREPESWSDMDADVDVDNEEDGDQDLTVMSPEERPVVDQKTFERVLKSMGITDATLEKPLAALSGGWRMRIALAKFLLYPPDLLLLDEPTNHLDIAGIAWLERCIRTLAEVTIVLVSHNRSFLNSVTDDIILFKNQKLEYFTGNYDQYIQTIEEKEAYAERMQVITSRTAL